MRSMSRRSLTDMQPPTGPASMPASMSARTKGATITPGATGIITITGITMRRSIITITIMRGMRSWPIPTFLSFTRSMGGMIPGRT